MKTTKKFIHSLASSLMVNSTLTRVIHEPIVQSAIRLCVCVLSQSGGPSCDQQRLVLSDVGEERLSLQH